MDIIELHAGIGQAVGASEEPVEGHAAATQDGAGCVCDLDEGIDRLDDLGAAGGGVRVRWHATPDASDFADAVEVAGVVLVPEEWTPQNVFLSLGDADVRVLSLRRKS